MGFSISGEIRCVKKIAEQAGSEVNGIKLFKACALSRKRQMYDFILDFNKAVLL